MSDGTLTPDDRRYTRSHEWLKAVGDTVEVGITDHAQAELTDIVFVDLPPIGKAIAAEGIALVLESVKTVADVYAPVAGSIAAVNAELKAHPEWVNQEPYGKGWLFRLTPDAPLEEKGTLSASEYAAFVASGA